MAPKPQHSLSVSNGEVEDRAEAPDHGAEGTHFFSARGDGPEVSHGPLQQLLDVRLMDWVVLALWGQLNHIHNRASSGASARMIESPHWAKI